MTTQTQPAPLAELEAAAVAARPPIIIQASRGWATLGLRELWEFRDLLYFMVWRDLKSRYRQTALGPLWFIVQPLMSMVLYTLVFGVIAKLPSENQPYTVFTYVALLPWTFFANTVASGTNSLLGSIGMISKVYFPRLIMPLAQVLSGLVDFAVSLLILLGMLWYYHITPTWGVLLIPFYLALTAMAGLGLGLWFAGVIVKYRDVGQVVGFVVRMLMYASPVVYSITLVPPEWLTLYRLNPVTAAVEGFRWALMGTGATPDWTLLVATLITLPIFIGGLFYFRRVERSIVDVA